MKTFAVIGVGNRGRGFARKITNDKNAKLVEVNFQSSKFPAQDDFLYVDEWDNRAETLFTAAPPEKSGCSSSLTVLPIASLTLLGAVYMLFKGGKKE